MLRGRPVAALTEARVKPEIEVALLTGGGDQPYAFGLATALISKGVCLDFIACDELDSWRYRGGEKFAAGRDFLARWRVNHCSHWVMLKKQGIFCATAGNFARGAGNFAGSPVAAS